ncbi:MULTISPECIES: NAD(P)-dependent oxidoreductase [Actinoalloteichus]|uniref:Beta-hydroxyacid dehydrogenase, 3-hydroxyisobutyrate dehydrogenase n=1 Tax=Actinoalloteichus fjordicus TaxID=1612552 RepID=A0AAC9LEL9_9PSEU|nr:MULTISPECIES: NAD(P)-binding domain-containing protein [Actinoalloteichus]APU14905.1 beta-hydroxyacid dehydrogenase, 3-hydroxyisobutyrate dehydrogenase [Actinoalloteichus fjordicus]APU20875.1 beta-hydroxyacid dehydrogenase, 3-hydroxyisobutyrate dehydrogenase [Actinoalloteichus sp. GBA129-24]
MSRQAVTVIGLGPMGQAMASALRRADHPVTVWNRTASKAAALVTEGAVLAATPAEAVAANELVILSLTDYAAMYPILEQAGAALAGRVIVNLSSDTPERTREGAAWVTARGARHLTGGVQVPPPQVATPGAATFYSGPEEVLDAHRSTLEVLTSVDFRGADPGLAALYYQLTIDLFWTTLVGYVHMLAVAAPHDISARYLLPYAAPALAGMPYFLEFYGERIDAGDHRGDVDRLSMAEASLDHVVHTTRAAGVDPTLPAAVLDLVRRGVAAGHGSDSISSLMTVFRRPAS